MNVIGSDSVLHTECTEYTLRPHNVILKALECSAQKNRKTHLVMRYSLMRRIQIQCSLLLAVTMTQIVVVVYNESCVCMCECVCSSLYSYVYLNSSVLTLPRDAAACTMSASHKCGILHFIASRKLTVLSLVCAPPIKRKLTRTFKHRANTYIAGECATCY